MSTYYDFYLAEQTEDKKYSLIGPYKKTKEGMEIYALLFRPNVIYFRRQS